jgi:mannose-1-phosphate guanylyltransferase/mannose-6-phosphate isomerase
LTSFANPSEFECKPEAHDHALHDRGFSFGLVKTLLQLHDVFPIEGVLMIVPVILAGGNGSRLWPLSQPSLPKAFIAVPGNDRTLLQSTFDRLKMVPALETPVVVCNAAHQLSVEAQLAGQDIKLLLEPQSRDTAPALCAAALAIEGMFGPEAIMLVLPADHVIHNEAALADAISSAGELAAKGYLVTFAIAPTEPATGYGYLKLGHVINEAKRQFHVDAFIEKPDQETARKLLASGQHAWNSGMLLFGANSFLKSFELLQPEILAACRAAVPVDAGCAILKIDEKVFARIPAVSVDFAIMEKAANVATVVADFGWSDVGDWNAVWQTFKTRQEESVTQGNVYAHDCFGSVIHSEGPLVVGVGLQDMIAVATRDAILVAPRAQAQQVKTALALLNRHNTVASEKQVRPWGWCEKVHIQAGYHVTEIAINPGAMFSPPQNETLAAYWICRAGQGVITCGEDRLTINMNESMPVPRCADYRLENSGIGMLHIIEVKIADAMQGYGV